MKWLLQLLCIHDWERQSFVEEYYDYSGYRVTVIRCKCKKCGKVKNKKFW